MGETRRNFFFFFLSGCGKAKGTTYVPVMCKTTCFLHGSKQGRPTLGSSVSSSGVCQSFLRSDLGASQVANQGRLR